MANQEQEEFEAVETTVKETKKKSSAKPPDSTPSSSVQTFLNGGLGKVLILVLVIVLALGGKSMYDNYFDNEKIVSAATPEQVQTTGLTIEDVKTLLAQNKADALMDKGTPVPASIPVVVDPVVNPEVKELQAKLRDREEELENFRSQFRKFAEDAKEAQKKTEMAEAEAKAKAAEAAEVVTQAKEKEGDPNNIVQVVFKPSELKSKFIGFDANQIRGYKVPLVRNSQGHPAPFRPDLAPPQEKAAPNSKWEVVEYTMLNGATVKAWAVKD